jgi:hypothetical protein
MGPPRLQGMLALLVLSLAVPSCLAKNSSRLVTNAAELGEALLNDDVNIVTIRGTVLICETILVPCSEALRLEEHWVSCDFDTGALKTYFYAGRVHLTKDNWVPHQGGTAIIATGRHVILQSGRCDFVCVCAFC